MIRRLSGTQRVWLLTAVLAAGSALLFEQCLAKIGLYQASLHIPWWMLAIGFMLAEIGIVNVQFKRETQSFSLNEIPLVLALFFSSCWELLLAQAVGSAAALIVHRRQAVVKWTFNLAHLSLEALVAIMVFRAIAEPGPQIGTTEVLGAFAATASAIVLGLAAVAAAISLAEGGVKWPTIGRVAMFGSIGTVTNTSIALLTVQLLRVQSGSALLMLIPAATLIVAYRGYTSYRRQHETLGQLYEATRSLQQSLEVEPVLHTLLQHAREMFKAAIAQVTLFPRAEGEPAFESTLGPAEGSETLSAVHLDPAEGVWATVAAGRAGVLLPRPIQDPALREHFGRRGIRDAMIVPLYEKAEVVGTLLVANRESDIESFRQENLTVLETFAHHVGATLENARLVSRLQRSLEELAEQNRFKGELLAHVSHDLRTPLAAMMAYLGLMRSDIALTDDERRTYVELMENQSRRLHGLIDDLLVAAQLEAEAFQPVVTTFPLADLVARVTDAFVGQDREFRVEVEESAERLTTDEEIVHRILANLVSNAVKYSPAESTITIAGRAEGRGVRIAVIDEGEGIPAEVHERVFERFFRADGGRQRKIRGVGLGLYICKGLAERIGARVWLERSALGSGSTFCLWVQSAVVTLGSAGDGVGEDTPVLA